MFNDLFQQLRTRYLAIIHQEATEYTLIVVYTSSQFSRRCVKKKTTRIAYYLKIFYKVYFFQIPDYNRV
jgi:hypothetical protein